MCGYSYQESEIEGESFFPIQVHGGAYYFYCSSMLFLFLLLQVQMQVLCQLLKSLLNTVTWEFLLFLNLVDKLRFVTYVLHIFHKISCR